MDKFVRNGNVVLRKIHSMYYLVDIKCNYTDKGHAIPALNEVGRAIWEALGEPATPDEIVRRIADTFDVSAVSEEEIKSDVNGYLTLLMQTGYVTNVC